MSIANKLTRKLQEVFGTEAADAMVDWMQRAEGGRAEHAKIDSRCAEISAKLDTAIATIQAESAAVEARLDAKLAETKAELFRWAAGFWIASLVTMAGVMAAVLKLSGA